MRLELICTGEELLTGQTVNTNASWLGAKLRDQGLHVSAVTTVGDHLDELIETFTARSQRADVIIVNGGLGPTQDDLSAKAAAAALDEPLVCYKPWLARLADYYRQLGRTMPPQNEKQAFLPRSARFIDNPIGTACGFSIRLNRAVLFFTPGVPRELKHMYHEQILPELLTESERRRLYRFHSFGISESRLSDLLETEPMPGGLELGFRAGLPTHEIKLTDLDADPSDVNRTLAWIRQQLGESLVCEGNQTLSQTVQQHMIEQGFTLALAESCTGGLVASELVANPGSSDYLDRAYVTYSNQAKQDMVDVEAGLLTEHGAVSLPVACAMARGARHRAGVSHALAITGIAGPSGGSDAKPVGTVGFALATKDGVEAQLLRFPDRGRALIRRFAMAVALDMLRRQLSGVAVCADYDYATVQQRLQQPA